MGVCQNCRSRRYPRLSLFVILGALYVSGMKTKKHDGFTLVEILIAITIFCFAVLGLAIGTVSVIRTNQTSHLRASAVNLAQARLEELRAMTSTAFSGLTCPSSTPCSIGHASARAYGCLRSASDCVTLLTMSPRRRGRPMGSVCGAGFRTRRQAGMRCSQTRRCR